MGPGPSSPIPLGTSSLTRMAPEPPALPAWLTPRPGSRPAALRPRRQVPSSRAVRPLAFACLTAAEFLLLTVLSGDAWFPGGWSVIGTLVFLLWAGALFFLVVRPFRPWVRMARQGARRTGAFLALVLGSFLVWIVGVDALQLAPAGSGPDSAMVLPILTPFGLFPTVEYVAGPLGGILNLQIVLTFLVISWLWGGVLLVEYELRVRRLACAPSSAGRTSRGSAPPTRSFLTWVPLLGLCSGCCSPPILEYAALAALPASGSYFTAFRSLNWMWDGALELASVVVLVFLIHRITAPGGPMSEELPESATIGEGAGEGAAAPTPAEAAVAGDPGSEQERSAGPQDSDVANEREGGGPGPLGARSSPEPGEVSGPPVPPDGA